MRARRRPSTRLGGALVEVAEGVLQAGPLDRHVGDGEPRQRGQEAAGGRPPARSGGGRRPPRTPATPGTAYRDGSTGSANCTSTARVRARRSSATGPTSSSRPSRIMATRSHSSSTSASDVAREDDRAARRGPLREPAEQAPLDDGVERGGGLVEDRQRRVVLQRGNQPELLLHPARVLAHAPAQRRPVELEHLAEALARRRRARVQPREGVEGPLAGEPRVEPELPGQVADLRRARPSGRPPRRVP